MNILAKVADSEILDHTPVPDTGAQAAAKAADVGATKKLNYKFNDAKEQLASWENLRRQLEDGEDDLDLETLLDTLDGETELKEVLLLLADEVAERDALTAGLKSYIETLTARKSRFERTAETIRTLITQCMDRAGLKTIPGERATLSLGARAAKLIVEDEAAIPAKFFKPQNPKLDTSALAKALKEAETTKEVIPGAKLSDPGIGLTIRVK